MADRRASEPVVFLVGEPPSGVADSPWIERRPWGAHGGLDLKFVCLIAACCAAARDCAHLRGGNNMKRLGLGIVVAIGLTLPAFGQGVDPLIGTWKLNYEKSTGSAFRSLTLTFTAAGGQNLVLTSDGVATSGPDAYQSVDNVINIKK
jgi:hypothetical protein